METTRPMTDASSRWASTMVASRLRVRYPIIQGPLGGGLSSRELTAAVSNAGGLGSFGANHLDPDAIRKLVPAIRRLTPQPFAVNLWVSTHDEDEAAMTRQRFDEHLACLRPYFDELGVDPPAYPERFGQRFDEQVRALLETGPPVFSFVFGVPPADVLGECRQRGIVTVGTATTPDEAVALDDAGVDMIVASGFEAGGHRGSFIESAQASLTGTMALVPVVADEVRAPVIAAGGIADGRGVVAALALGAQGVQIGTAFLACEESAASPAHRALLHGSESRRTVLTRAFTGRFARGIPNRLSRDLEEDDDPAAIASYPFQVWFLKHLRPTLVREGRSDLMSLWSGQAAPLLRHTHAADLFRALVEETSRAVERMSTGTSSAASSRQRQ